MKNCLTILILVVITNFFVNAQSVNLTSSNLPIVLIDTDGGAEIPDEPKIGADMIIISRPDGTDNLITDVSNSAYLNYDGRIAIEVRGQSSQQFAKKQYKLDLMSALDTATINEEILGMPSESDWILHGPYIDKSLMRNVLTYELSRRLGRYAPRTRYCEVVLNGEYVGVYVLMESIKVDNDRVDVEKLDATDIALPDMTGGYIWKVDKDGPGFTSTVTNNDRYRWHDPNADQLTVEQKSYLQTAIEDFETVMNGSSYNDPINGYPAHIDVAAWVDQFILQEFANNPDAFGSSMYYHKYRNGKLRMGPVWDMNLALGSSYYGLAHYTTIWTVQIGHAMVGPPYNQKLFNDQDFRCLMGDRWFELRFPGSPLHQDSINALIDGYAMLLDEAQDRNFTKWNNLGTQVWLEAPGYQERDTYQKEVDYLKQWISDRLTWIDANIYLNGSCPSGMPDVLAINEIHYNPYVAVDQDENLFEFIEIVNKSSAAIDISGVQLTLGVQYTFPSGSQIPGNGFIVLANDAVSFQQRYGFNPFATYQGSLSNSGERIVLADVYGNILDDVTYNDKLPWPVGTDGFGSSLELIDPTFDNSLPENWFANSAPHGSPNEQNIEEIFTCTNPMTGVIINEIHYNPSALMDGGDWVEFYNTTNGPIDMSNCEFRDNSNIFVIPQGTILEAGEYIVLAQDLSAFLGIYPGTSNVIGSFSFGLNNGGELIQLYDINGCMVDEVLYDDFMPWVTSPDGNGPSLSLLDPMSNNDFSSSWSSSVEDGGTPGTANFEPSNGEPVGSNNVLIKVVLEGYKISANGTMRTSLRDNNLLPNTQCYNVAPYNYNGGESVTTFPASTVDWVYVEIRSNTDRNIVIAQKALLLRNDGYLMNTDGTLDINFGVVGTHYIAVYHKSHMGVISSGVVNLNIGLIYDFTSGVNMAFGIQQLKAVDLVTVLHCGDFDGNGIINNLDINLWNAQSAVVNQYVSWDADGNGIVNNLDSNLWDTNKSKVGVPEISF